MIRGNGCSQDVPTWWASSMDRRFDHSGRNMYTSGSTKWKAQSVLSTIVELLTGFHPMAEATCAQCGHLAPLKF